MTLPLPYNVGDTDDPIQGNFDFIAQRFPLSRRDLKLEAPHIVGGAGEPALQNSWVNYTGAPVGGYAVTRFWKDPLGMVHVQGMVEAGTPPSVVFTLPAGYRPGKILILPTYTFGGVGRITVGADGAVTVTVGHTTWTSLSIPSFRQEL